MATRERIHATRAALTIRLFELDAGALTINRRPEPVQAVELSPQEASGFFKDVLAPYVTLIPLGRFLLGTLPGAKEMLTDPNGAAQRHPVFELRPHASAGSSAGPPPRG